MANRYHRIFSLGNVTETNTDIQSKPQAIPLKPLNDTSGSTLNVLSKTTNTTKKTRAKSYNGWSMPSLWGRSLPDNVKVNPVTDNVRSIATAAGSPRNIAGQKTQNDPPRESLAGCSPNEEARYIKDTMQAEIGRRRRSAFTTLQNVLTRQPSINTHVISAAPQSQTPNCIIAFDSIPATVGLNAIISQVCGGPLEKIVRKRDPLSSRKYGLELHFLQNEQAMMFYQYANSGRFVVNGQVYLPRIPWNSGAPQRDRKIVRAMVVDKARRCVILNWNTHYQFVSQYQRSPLYAYEEKNDNSKKTIRPVLYYHEHPMIIHKGKNMERKLPQQPGLPFLIRNSKQQQGVIQQTQVRTQTQPQLPTPILNKNNQTHQWSSSHQPPSRHPKSIENGNPFNVNLDITLDHIQKCFETLGEIVAIMPMIKPLPTICIQYADVRPAIEAYKIFNKLENPNPIWTNFFDKWNLQYGVDPTDRTCPPSA